MEGFLCLKTGFYRFETVNLGRTALWRLFAGSLPPNAIAVARRWPYDAVPGMMAVTNCSLMY